MEGNYCGCGTWYEASVLEVIPQGDSIVVYFIKYIVDGEEETVSAENIRSLSTTSDESGMITSPVSEEDCIVTEPIVKGDTSGSELGSPPQFCEAVAYKSKMSIGDDGSYVPELYEGMLFVRTHFPIIFYS